MSIPVVICDDSSFARKQIGRALPSGWDVVITYAANGLQAIEAVRAGQGDILFLDLTMPEMDGFDVLEVIRREDLPTMTVVVSGDIQPESQRRVQQLGAVAFLKKPVDGEELSAVLQDYGVLGVLRPDSPAMDDHGVEFADWVQEMSNVAMGRAADLLAQLIDAPIELSVPRVALLEPGELNMALATCSDAEGMSIISQGFIGGGMAGETLLFFSNGDTGELARLMRYRDTVSEGTEMELLMEVANVLVGAFLKGMADQMDIGFSQGHPIIHSAHSRGGGKLECNLPANHQVLTIEFSYIIGERRLQCDQLVLFTERSVSSLQQRIAYVGH